MSKQYQNWVFPVVAQTTNKQEADAAISALKLANVPFKVEFFKKIWYFRTPKPETLQKVLVKAGVIKV